MENEVEDVMIFTRMLDGGAYFKCICSHIMRLAIDDKRECLACGRGKKHFTESTEEEYKLSRK